MVPGSYKRSTGWAVCWESPVESQGFPLPAEIAFVFNLTDVAVPPVGPVRARLPPPPLPRTPRKTTPCSAWRRPSRRRRANTALSRQSVSQSISQSVGQSVGQSVSQSVSVCPLAYASVPYGLDKGNGKWDVTCADVGLREQGARLVTRRVLFMGRVGD
eukprot:355576-Prorocentrum_minimum.AAC.1